MIRTHALLAILLLAPLAGAFAADIDREKPGQAEWTRALDALGRGECLLVQARQIGPREPALKREAYTLAEGVLKESLGWIEAYRLVRPEPQTVVEETIARVHRGLYECRKSKPLSIG